MIRVFVIHDDRLSLERLHAMLAKFADVQLVGSATDQTPPLQEIAACDPHVVFLECRKDSGFQAFARDVIQCTPSVVLVSASAEDAVAAFDLGAIDFLLKPFALERLAESLNRVRERRHTPVRRSLEAPKSKHRQHLKPGLY